MENKAKNTCEENRRIVQEGMERRAEARAQDEHDAKQDAVERDFRQHCNQITADRRKSQEQLQAERAQADAKAKARVAAEQRREVEHLCIMNTSFVFIVYCIILFLLHSAKDLGVPASVTIPLAVAAAMSAIAGIILLNISSARKVNKRRAAR